MDYESLSQQSEEEPLLSGASVNAHDRVADTTNSRDASLDDGYDGATASAGAAAAAARTKTTRVVAIALLFLFQIPVLLLLLAMVPKYFTNFDAAMALFYASLDTTAWNVQVAAKVHIYFATLVCLLGPIQLLFGLCHLSNTKWHKYGGYAYTVSMVLMVLLGAPVMIWNRAQDTDGFDNLDTAVDYSIAIIYTAVSLVWGVRAIRAGNKVRHRAMMMRSYLSVFIFAVVSRSALIPYCVTVLVHRIDLLNPTNEELIDYVDALDKSSVWLTILFYPSIIALEILMWHTPFSKVIRGE